MGTTPYNPKSYFKQMKSEFKYEAAKELLELLTIDSESANAEIINRHNKTVVRKYIEEQIKLRY